MAWTDGDLVGAVVGVRPTSDVQTVGTVNRGAEAADTAAAPAGWPTGAHALRVAGPIQGHDDGNAPDARRWAHQGVQVRSRCGPPASGAPAGRDS